MERRSFLARATAGAVTAMAASQSLYALYVNTQGAQVP
jgi:hypothetical protein